MALIFALSLQHRPGCRPPRSPPSPRAKKTGRQRARSASSLERHVMGIRANGLWDVPQRQFSEQSARLDCFDP